ncbi:hypothetical protein NUU61_006581 [Penicillium alfredii]|uniref:Uncharacterized protein n=1 Tax=Penicillium alfredii TaxID=1506179 RepID=A0A9W9K3W8_9EURO|nr:uncharacterized protein NUU61_006581 [Penicillium alfredii]KAJ5091711.1 hypothetical protein NUU61_006581 [Penicillium alfredii]
MKCLDIPVDHRLLPIIQQMKIPPSEQPSSHLTILNNFAENHPTGTPIPSSEIHHGLELAGPDRKGGVLVTLLQPPRTQTYENGYPADLASCPTTKAVNELIATATNHQLSIDEVCAFDRLPYVHGGFNNDDDEVIQEAERTFEDMVRTKEPQVVLCCYGQKSSLMRGEITWGLYGQGVGEVFKVPEFAISSDCTTKRVNAFHPSYAVNYYTSYSCFRRLLLLEFVQAFCLLVGPWKEEQWMRDLRSECSSLGKRLYSNGFWMNPLFLFLSVY